MTEQKRRTDPLAREPLPFANLQQIGRELRVQLTEIVAEPLPAELQELLDQLERKLDGTDWR
jgi:hypothetical protein